MKQKSTFLKVFMTLMLLMGVSNAWADGTLVESLSNIKDGGTYYIAAFNSSKYYTVPNSTISGQTFTCTEGSFNTVSKTLVPANGAGEFVFTKVNGVDNAYYIYNTNLSKYLVATGSRAFGYVEDTNDNYGYWTFSTVSSGGYSGIFSVEHSSKTHYMRAYNNSVRCYDGASNNGVYFFEVQKSTKVLKSISITGSLEKTEYMEGQPFDFSGLKAIGLYDDDTDDDITSMVEWSVDPSTLTTDVTSVSIIASLNGITSSPFVDDNITVTPFVQNYANTYTSDDAFSSVIDGYTVKWEGEPVGYPAWKGNKGDAVSLTVPADTKTLHFHIVTWNGENSPITIKNGDKTIGTITPKDDAGVSGSATTYTLASEPCTEDNYFTLVLNATEATTITFTPSSKKRFILFGVNIESAGEINISSVGYSTYSSTSALVVPVTSVAEVFGAKVNDAGTAVTLIPVVAGTVLEAGTGFIVKGTANATVTFTVSSEDGEAISGNELLGTGNGTLDLNAGDAYLLGAKDGKAVFALCNAGTLGANKAYLPAPAGANGTLGFDDATGIEFELQDAKSNVIRYNLNGQVVGNDYKGIVIVNGKKFLNK